MHLASRIMKKFAKVNAFIITYLACVIVVYSQDVEWCCYTSYDCIDGNCPQVCGYDNVKVMKDCNAIISANRPPNTVVNVPRLPTLGVSQGKTTSNKANSMASTAQYASATTTSSALTASTSSTTRNGGSCIVAQAAVMVCNSYQLAKPIFEAAATICEPENLALIAALAATLIAVPATTVIGSEMAVAIGDIAWDCVMGIVKPRAVLEAFAGFEIEEYCSLENGRNEGYLMSNCDSVIIYKRDRAYLTYSGFKRQQCPITTLPVTSDIDKAVRYVSSYGLVRDNGTLTQKGYAQYDSQVIKLLEGLKTLSNMRAELGTDACSNAGAAPSHIPVKRET